MSIAETIRKARNSAGITQLELADAVGVHVASVRNWEKGSIPGDELKKKIAHFLKLNIDELEENVVDPLEEFEVAELQKALHHKTARLLKLPLEKVRVSVEVLV